MEDLKIMLQYGVDTDWIKINYNEVYNYLMYNSITETIKHFGEGIINIMIESYIEQLLKDVGL